MSQLPIGWALTSLGEIVTLRAEKADPATVPDQPFIGLDGIEPHTSEIINVGKAADVKSAVACFEEGDVLYSRLRPYLNKVTIPNFSGVASAEIYVLQPTGATDAELVRRRIMTGEFLEFAALLDKGDRPRVSYKDISTFPIALPPKAEQRRIVEKVDSLTSSTARARKELGRIPTLIARYKRRLLGMAASGELTEEWRKDRKSTGWQRVSVEAIAEATFDGPFGSNLKSADYAAEGIRVVRLENIGRLDFIKEKETYISKKKHEGLKRHTLQADDVLFSSFIAEEIRVCRLPDDLPTVAINKADCFCVRPKAKACSPAYLTFRLAAPQTYEVLKEAVHGATRPRISLKQLKAFTFDLPTIEEQLEIVRCIDSALAWLDRLGIDHAAATRLLPKLDAALIAKAFRGELVPQDPDDEPASVLLARTKAQRADLKDRPKNSRGDKFEGTIAEPHLVPMRAEVARPNKPLKVSAMLKSRRDDDVWQQPYLARLLKSKRVSDPQPLFRLADLPVADFYKQLAWEIDNGYIIDDTEKLKAA